MNSLPSVKVICACGHSWVTSVSAGITNQEIKDYFLNQVFNIGTEQDKLVKCVAIEINRAGMSQAFNTKGVKELTDRQKTHRNCVVISQAVDRGLAYFKYVEDAREYRDKLPSYEHAKVFVLDTELDELEKK